MNDGLIPVPAGHVAAVVTFLEMTERPALARSVAAPFRLEAWFAFDADRYRALFRRVGARWLWFSRLAMTDTELRERAGEIHSVIDKAGQEVGIVELDFRTQATCHIRFLGLVPELAGRGHGPWLFEETLRRAWANGIERVEVHTCSLDHPAALSAYLKAGFRAVGRAFESFPDPRLAGVLPREAAPTIPLIEAARD
jgi:GNAT superfamily N-acetyltransferase